MDAGQTAVLVSFSKADFTVATASYPGAIAAMNALLRRRQEALSDAGLVALGLKAKPEELRMLAEASKCSALFPGEPVFGPGREQCLAVVLWGEVKLPGEGGKAYGEGAKLRTAAASGKAGAAEAADGAVAADAPEGMRTPSERAAAAAGGAAANALVPTAVVLWLDLRGQSQEQLAARRKLEEKLARERAEREAQKIRIHTLQGEVKALVDVLTAPPRTSNKKWLSRPQSIRASESRRHGGEAASASASASKQSAHAHVESGAKGKSMADVIAELEAEKAALTAELASNRAKRGELVRELRSTWNQLEDPGSPAIPITATEALELAGCDSRACVPILQETLAAAKDMLVGRRALIDAMKEDIERVVGEMSIVAGDPEWLDLDEVASKGIHRSVLVTLNDHAEMLRQLRRERLEAAEGALSFSSRRQGQTARGATQGLGCSNTNGCSVPPRLKPIHGVFCSAHQDH